MTVSFFLCQLAAFVVYFVATSFFEWAFHRYGLHTPRWNRTMFSAHTLTHHQVYKGDESYHTDVEHPLHVPMNWWALPALIGVHLPVYILVQFVTGVPSVWGGVLAISAYYGIYESLHWGMHVPRTAAVLNRFPAFRFLDAHHLVHHRFMLSNLNVVLPLADLVFGTLRRADGSRVRPFWKRAPKMPLSAPKPHPLAIVTE